MTRGRRPRGLLVLVWLAAAPSCLPTGEPPAGRQLWAGRTRTIMEVQPARSLGEEVTRVLTLQQRAGESRSDLYALTVAASGEVSDRLVVEEWGCAGVGPCLEFDHEGRLLTWVRQEPPEPPSGILQIPDLVRVNLDTGERMDLGAVGKVSLSPSRARVALSLGGPGTGDGGMILIEADDTRVSLPTVDAGAFAGETFYFVDPEAHALLRLAAGGEREVIQDRVQHFEVLNAAVPILLFREASDNPVAAGPISLLNPVTGQRWPLPLGVFRTPSLSPDGRWAVIHEAGEPEDRRFVLADLSTGVMEPFELPGAVQEPRWRPGRAEVWCVAAAYPDRTTFIKRPGEPLRQLAAGINPFSANGSFFTADGDQLFSQLSAASGEDGTIVVGDADQPEGPRFPLNPGGTHLAQYHELPDERLVVEAFYRGPDRNDIYLVDPDNGATHLLGKAGNVVALGATRVLALLHRNDGAGDLVAIDVDSRRSTPLALEYARDGAVVQPRGDGDPDVVRPGAPVAYSFRARFASPYDGIWVTAIP